MEHMANAGPAGLYGQGFLALVHADDQRQVASCIPPGSSGHGVPRCQFRLECSESPRWIRDEQHTHQLAGRPAVLNSLSDISERRRASNSCNWLPAYLRMPCRLAQGDHTNDAERQCRRRQSTPLPGSSLGYSRDEALGQNSCACCSSWSPRPRVLATAMAWRSLLDKAAHWYGGNLESGAKWRNLQLKCRPSGAVCDEDAYTTRVALFSTSPDRWRTSSSWSILPPRCAGLACPTRVLLADRPQQP